MKTLTYSEKLKHPKWQKKRLEILSRDEFTCQECGDTETNLQIHHLYYEFGKDVWDYKNEHLKTLCNACHKDISSVKKEIKSIIDLSFTNYDVLSELHGILTYIYKFDPADLSNVVSCCQKIHNKKIHNKIKK